MTLPYRLAAGLLLAVAGSASAARPPSELVQPTDSRRDLILASASGRAHIEQADGRRQRIPLGRTERLTEMVETWGGWVAAGVDDTSGHPQTLVLITSENDRIQRLPAPAGQRMQLRLRPILLTEMDRLVGLAWLEGDEFGGLAVHAADWDGFEWSEPIRVTPEGAGNQTGLTGVVLANGSWLLAWSQFDGHDDEIFWSVRRGGSWSDPRRLDINNRFPDITPHLVSQPHGALLAWSRSDGRDYWLILARFRSGSWRAPEPVGGRGTVDPHFARRDEQIYLLYRTAWPSDWTVATVTGGGRLERQAVFPEAPAARPVLQASGSQGASLSWPSARRGVESPWESVP